MIPEITKGDLLMLPRKKQHKICNCPQICTRFFTFENDDTDFMLCENNTKMFGEQLFKEFVPEAPKEGNIYAWWTKEEEAFLIKYIQEFGIKKGSPKYGTTKTIANALNRPYEQVRSKIKRLRKQGRL